MSENKSYKLGLHVALCALFLSFIFIENGIIGRLRYFNYIILVLVVALTIREFIRALRGSGK